jgi:hypothetical protein
MSWFFTHHRDTGYDTNPIRVPLTDDYVHDLDAMLAAITPKYHCDQHQQPGICTRQTDMTPIG